MSWLQALGEMLGAGINGYQQAASSNDSDFSSLMRKLCGANGWSIDEMNSEAALLLFRDGRGEQKSVAVFDTSPMERIAVMGGLSFPPESIPHPLSSLLMARGSTGTAGCWVLVEGRRNAIYACQQFVPLGILTPQQLAQAIQALIAEYAQVEEVVRARELMG